MRTKQKTDKGVAGLTILLSLVTMLFVIGLLVMIFSMMGGEMRNATFTTTDTASENETYYYLNDSAGNQTVDYASAQDFTNFALTYVENATDGTVIPLANFTQYFDGNIINATAHWPGEYALNISYNYTYGAENTATRVMNDTTAGISSVTDWFAIFVVIGAMVVLILLIVIIITAIRGSGLMEGGSA